MEKLMVNAMVHSVKEVQMVEMLGMHDGNSYTVKTRDGITCTAIFNMFTGLYYADDLYGIIERGETE